MAPNSCTSIGRYRMYLGYVVRHKWYVFWAARRLGIMKRGLFHDLSKFRPSELIPYARSFYNRNGSPRGDWPEGVKGAFDRAWLLHQHRNPHHWQYWILRQDDGTLKVLPMPDEYVREMVADWIGAGIAQEHGNDILPWYLKNRDRMILHSETRTKVESLLRIPRVKDYYDN